MDGVAMGCRNKVEGVVTRYWGPTEKFVPRLCAEANRVTSKITVHKKLNRYARHIASSRTLNWQSVTLKLVFAADAEP